jgi:acetyl esterase/lipase
MLDDRSSLRRDLDERWFRLWDTASNTYGWTSYLGTAPGAPEVPAHAVPARTADPAGLPPAWIGVGSLDLFHDEDLAYALALRAAGVACDLEVIEGAFHGFDMVMKADVVRRFHASQVAALTAAFAA